MDLEYLKQRYEDALARAGVARSAPARIAHQRMARAYADRIAAEKAHDNPQRMTQAH